MKPLRHPRWAWNLFCAFSLLIFATSVTLWVRSIRPLNLALVRDPTEAWFVAVQSGRMGILRQTGSPRLSHGPQIDVSRRPLTAEVKSIGSTRYIGGAVYGRFMEESFGLWRDGVSWWKPGDDGTLVQLEMHQTKLILPLWLFLIFAAPPLVWWRQRRKRLGPAQGGRGFPLEAAAANSARSSQRREGHEEKTI